MAQVPYTGVQTVTPDISGSGATYSAVPQANANAFGANVGEAVGGIGQQVTKISDHFQQLYNESTARDAVTKTAQDLSDEQAKFGQLKGNDAVNGLKGHQDRIKQIVADNSEGMSMNANALYQTDAAKLVNNAIYSAGAHVATQAEQAHLSSLKGSQDVNANLYAQDPSSPSAQTYYNNAIHAAGEHAAAMGLTGDAKISALTTASGDMLASAIKAKVQNDPDGAQKLLDLAKSPINYQDVDPATGKVVTYQAPRMDATQHTQVATEMQAEFKRQAQNTLWDASSFASSGENYNKDSVTGAMLRAGYTKEDADAHINHLDNVQSNFGTADAQYNLKQKFDNDEALVYSYRSPTGIYDPAEIAKAFRRNPEKAQQFLSEVNQLHQVAGFVGGMFTRTPAENQAELYKFKPTGSSTGSSSFNLGNVKTARGAADGTAEFVQPATPIDGAILAANTLRNGYQGLTISQIGEKWAPSSENKTSDWVNNVSKASGLSADTVPNLSDPSQLKAVLKGIATAEKSPSERANFSDDVLDKGVQESLAGKQAAIGGQNFDEQSNVYAKMQKAYTDFYKKLNDDPAGLIIQNDARIGPMFQDAVQDTKNSQKMVDYVNKVSALQEAMQIPESYRSVLPKQYAISLSDNLSSNPEQSPIQLAKMANDYGNLWPQVYKSLVQQGGLQPAYQIVQQLGANPATANHASFLARYIGSDETKGKTDEVLMGGEKTLNQLKTDVATNSSMLKLTASLAKANASAQLIASTIGSAQKLAMAIKLYDPTDPNPAATAIQDITSKYAYLEGTGARVPADKFETIANNTQVVIDDIENKMHPAQFVPPTYGDRQQYINDVKAEPSWVTRGSDNKVYLYDHFGRAVMGLDNKQISVGFDDAPMPNNLPDNSFTGRLREGLEGLAQ